MGVWGDQTRFPGKLAPESAGARRTTAETWREARRLMDKQSLVFSGQPMRSQACGADWQSGLDCKACLEAVFSQQPF